MQGRGAGPTTIGEAVEWLRKHFRPEAARSAQVVYRIELAGEGGGVLSVRVDDGRLEARDGPLDEPDVVFRLAAADYFDILAGRANPDLLFMSDRIEIEGDLSLALKLRSLFGPAT